METIKRLLNRKRMRRIPDSFSWVDHRLVRHRHISLCSHEGLALYLFLVTVADAQGLSYYSDGTAGKFLRMDVSTLRTARADLIRAGLVAYKSPLYQVLSLDGCENMRGDKRERRGGVETIAQILQNMKGGGND